MKHRVNLPYHEMLELVTSYFEVNAKVVHNGDVISEGLRRREVSEPAAPFTFREVNPAARQGRCSHDLGVFLKVGRGGVSEGWGRAGQDLRQTGTRPPGLCRKNVRHA
jgi:hypothetical protein